MKALDLVSPRARKPAVERFMSKVRILANGCWEWTGAMLPKGNGSFRIGGGGHRAMEAHRCAWLLFRGEIHDDQVVYRTRLECSHIKCVNPEHLSCGTRFEQALCKIERGSMEGRELKWTKEKIAVMRRLYESGWLLRQIAARYGTSRCQVWQLVTGWREKQRAQLRAARVQQ